MLWLVAHTETYFTPNADYAKTIGDQIQIRKCDVRVNEEKEVLDAIDQTQSLYKGRKEYDSSYVWGQLIGWFKQTVDKPNASLSADRRGTLSMPDFDSFILNSTN